MRQFIAYPREDWKTCDELRKPQKQLCRLFGVTCSTGSAFADIGLADPGERQTKTRLAMALNHNKERSLKQAGAAALLGVPQPKVFGAGSLPGGRVLGREANGLHRCSGA